MEKRLSEGEFDKLREIIQRRNPDLLSIPFFAPRPLLTEEEREAIRETLADELTEVGLRSDSEPNEYGVFIDEIIGKLGNY